MSTSSDDEWHPDYITLGPGGIRGLYMVGTLHTLKRKKRLSKVKGYGACSVGSSIALLTIIGYDPIEIVTVGVNMQLFIDFHSVKLGDRMNEMVENKGLLSSHNVRVELEKLVTAKLGCIPTLLELYNHTAIELYISAYNVTKERVEIFSHLTHPHMSCVTAIMLAVNIPFFFYELKYEGDVYIDAAFVYPLVISPFDTGYNNILVIYVDARDNNNDSNLLTSYIHKIMISPVRRLRDVTIANSSPRCRFLCINSGVTDVTGTSVSSSDKANMVLCGMNAMDEYIEKLDDPNYKYLHITEHYSQDIKIEMARKRVFTVMDK